MYTIRLVLQSRPLVIEPNAARCSQVLYSGYLLCYLDNCFNKSKLTLVTKQLYLKEKLHRWQHDLGYAMPQWMQLTITDKTMHKTLLKQQRITGMDRLHDQVNFNDNTHSIALLHHYMLRLLPAIICLTLSSRTCSHLPISQFY